MGWKMKFNSRIILFATLCMILLHYIVEGLHARRLRYRQNHGLHRKRRWPTVTSSDYNFAAQPVFYSICNFDLDTCGWNQLKVIDFLDWERKLHRQEHSPSNGTNYFMAIQEMEAYVDEYADLISPPLLLTTNTTKVKVSFSYYANGNSQGRADIFVMYPRYDTKLYLIGRVTPTSQRNWRHYSCRSFTPKYSRYRIILRGVLRQVSRANNFAIDDVTVIPIETTCYTNNGEFYRGSISTTEKGQQCISWSSKSLVDSQFHQTNYSHPTLVSNYCRNVNGTRQKPWCYIHESNNKWQYCNIPKCNPIPPTDPPYPLGSRNPIALVSYDRGLRNIGRLVIYHDQKWGTVHNVGISEAVIGILCKHFGFDAKGSLWKNDSWFEVEDQPVWLNSSNINCPNSATSLSACTIGPWNSPWRKSRDIWIECYSVATSTADYTTIKSPLTNMTVSPILSKTPSTLISSYSTSFSVLAKAYRLSIMGGKNATSGMLYVRGNNQNGTVCSPFWDLNSADVVCRQMGFIGAYSVKVVLRQFPITSSLISRIDCHGYESSVNQCNVKASLHSTDCPLSDIARISCNDGQENYTQTIPAIVRSVTDFVDGKITGVGAGFGMLPIQGNRSYIALLKLESFDGPLEGILVSPLLKRGGSSIYVTFRYYITSYTFDSLEVEYATLDGSFSTLYRRLLDTGALNTWHFSKTLPLPAGLSPFQIRFICKAVNNINSYRSVVALTDMRIIGAHYLDLPTPKHSSIIGITVGCSIGVIIIGFLVYFFWSSIKQKRDDGPSVTRTCRA
ncbi:Hepatocyte growth factor-like protein [Trichoplax sp. H2]|nr:Hepatocyte growth factor-like protein [Trichoplax sp. H2]|eukprot:RDD37231.1 Hepatocyte growth factor-like protein [Trichoplax sp. H2]